MPSQELTERYGRALIELEEAVDRLEPLLASMALAEVAEVLPGAHALVTFSERDLDDVLRIRVTSAVDERGVVLFDVEQADSCGAVDAVLMRVATVYLERLAEIVGGELLGSVTAAPSWLSPSFGARS
jgi:hypothetical protein